MSSYQSSIPRLRHIVSSSHPYNNTADKAPTLRGVSQPTSEEIETIIHQAKRDAFVTVMEMGKEEFGGCANKNGCAMGYDYCTKSKAHGKRCGPCVVTDKHPILSLTLIRNKPLLTL